MPKGVAVEGARSDAMKEQAQKMLKVLEKACDILDHDCHVFWTLILFLRSESTQINVGTLLSNNAYIQHFAFAQTQAKEQRAYDCLPWEKVKTLLEQGRNNPREIRWHCQIAALHRCFGDFLAYSITLGKVGNVELLFKKHQGIHCSWWRTRFEEVELMRCRAVEPMDLVDCKTLAAIDGLLTHQYRITALLNSSLNLDNASSLCEAKPEDFQLLSLNLKRRSPTAEVLSTSSRCQISISPCWRNTLILFNTSNLIPGKDIDDFRISFSNAEKAAAPPWLQSLMKRGREVMWEVVCRIKSLEGLEQFTYWQQMLLLGLAFMSDRFKEATAAQITFLSLNDQFAHGR
jgi:hypothetical protein